MGGVVFRQLRSPAKGLDLDTEPELAAFVTDEEWTEASGEERALLRFGLSTVPNGGDRPTSWCSATTFASGGRTQIWTGSSSLANEPHDGHGRPSHTDDSYREQQWNDSDPRVPGLHLVPTFCDESKTDAVHSFLPLR